MHLAVAWRTDPRWPLVAAANRDERLVRPAEGWPLRQGRDGARWAGPRDAKEGGTWIGVGGNTLYVSLPRGGQVAFANMQSFRVEEKVETGDVPVRLAMHPSGRYLWVGNNSPDKNTSGVTIIDTQTRRIASSLTLGLGHHELAFTPDGKYALVTSETDGELALIDAVTFKVSETVKAGELPVGLIITSDGKQALVADGGSGSVDIFSLPDLVLQKSISLKPGLTSLSLTSDGRWAFALNPNQDQVSVIDVATGELRHTFNIGARRSRPP